MSRRAFRDDGGAGTAAAPDRVSFSRPRHLPGLELVRASYGRRSFPVHSHPEYVVGAVVEGAERLTIRGADHVLGAGSVLLIHPEEAHANEAIGEQRLTYCVFYIPPDLLARTLGEGGVADTVPPRFGSPVVRSPRVYRSIAKAHQALCGDGDALEQQSAFLALLEAITGRAGEPPDAPRPASGAVRTARDYLDSHFRDGPGLTELARLSGLSPFHLLRSFRRQLGISPAAYRNQRRVMEARRLLRAGEPIAEVAAEVGFVDQSHLTRHFQRVMGTTPARYAAQ